MREFILVEDGVTIAVAWRALLTSRDAWDSSHLSHQRNSFQHVNLSNRPDRTKKLEIKFIAVIKMSEESTRQRAWHFPNLVGSVTPRQHRLIQRKESTRKSARGRENARKKGTASNVSHNVASSAIILPCSTAACCCKGVLSA